MDATNVAIGIVVKDQRILVCHRLTGDRFERFWEFPGGKLQEQESATECLHRELMEELGVGVYIRARLAPVTHDYGDMVVCLHPFIAELERGQPKPLASRELRWVTMDELADLPLPAANTNLVRSLPQILSALDLV